MNELITKPHVEIATDNFCRHCGIPLTAHDNFCGNCGAGCRDLIEIADPLPPTSLRRVATKPVSVATTNDGLQSVKAVLNNRLAVIGIIAFVGPPGLLALWFSPRFATRTKIVTTATYFLLTAVIPLAIAWYWLDHSLRPLVDVFGK